LAQSTELQPGTTSGNLDSRERPSVWVELLGAETKLYRGKKFVTRAIEMGSGDPLVLLHGMGGHAEAYARNVATLAKHFHVYSIDMIYHGYSTKEPYRADDIVSAYTDHLEDFLDTIGAQWAHIEGESLGSIVATHFGLRHPDRCGKLILNTGSPLRSTSGVLDSDAGDRKRLAETSLAAVRDVDRATIRKRMEWLMVPERITDEIVEIRYRIYKDPEINASLTRMYTHMLLENRISDFVIDEATCRQLKPKALAFWTEHNPSQGPAVGERLAEVIGCGLYTMADAGHWPQWEKPEEHDEVVLDFLGAS
jgi:pimeloyl-ACP methyl ester carboxylesterase